MKRQTNLLLQFSESMSDKKSFSRKITEFRPLIVKSMHAHINIVISDMYRYTLIFSFAQNYLHARARIFCLFFFRFIKKHCH